MNVWEILLTRINHFHIHYHVTVVCEVLIILKAFHILLLDFCHCCVSSLPVARKDGSSKALFKSKEFVILFIFIKLQIKRMCINRFWQIRNICGVRVNIPVRFCFLTTAVGVVLIPPELHIVLVRELLDVEGV